jgi:CRISPR-associated protein Cas6
MTLPAANAAEPIVDLQFAVQGHAVPLDHAAALGGAVREVLPWFEADPLAGVHPLSGLSPGESDTCYLSRRSRLTLRLARDRVPDALTLVGTSLQLDDCRIVIGDAKVRDLIHMPVLYAAFVNMGPIGEIDFMQACQQELAALGLAPRLICGMAQRASTPQGLLTGFSLMLYDLNAAGALLLQRQGLGGERKHGCGIFVPHKTISAVGAIE